ncbi:MAG TPA: type VI secretion system tip protein VgrG, partial [Nannocystis sp.]
SYSNTFTVTELKAPFRPARVTPKPVMRGLQSAVVVGPEGEEIHTDEHGRVRVQFHWDREGEFDEHSTCWIRVAQLWAGNGWGAMFLPRIGHDRRRRLRWRRRDRSGRPGPRRRLAALAHERGRMILGAGEPSSPRRSALRAPPSRTRHASRSLAEIGATTRSRYSA